jgi:hypothetical protein
MRTKARKLERKTRAAELDMEIMRAREANGLPVISPMLGLPPEKWECEFRDYLVALGDQPVTGQHASRPERAFAQWIAFVRAAIGDCEQAALVRDYKHLFAIMPKQFATIAAEFLAFQPSRGKHVILSSCRWGNPVGAAARTGEEVVLTFDLPAGSEKVVGSDPTSIATLDDEAIAQMAIALG